MEIGSVNKCKTPLIKTLQIQDKIPKKRNTTNTLPYTEGTVNHNPGRKVDIKYKITLHNRIEITLCFK
ncbi:MAG: hypothetical protein WCO66_03465 [Candidatus Absconditabacteria bacterium]